MTVRLLKDYELGVGDSLRETDRLHKIGARSYKRDRNHIIYFPTGATINTDLLVSLTGEGSRQYWENQLQELIANEEAKELI